MRSAALTAAVVAQVAALGEKRHEPDAAPSWRGRLAALAVAGAAPALALVLCAEGWRLARTESLRLGSQGEDGDARLALIEAATRAAPELADLHLEAARDYGRRYEQESAADPARAARDFLLPALAHYVQARDLCPLSAAEKYGGGGADAAGWPSWWPRPSRSPSSHAFGRWGRGTTTASRPTPSRSAR